MSRRTIFWLVVALAGTILLAVVGAIVFAVLDKNGALGLMADLEDEAGVYLAVFGLVFADAIVPIFPGETTLTTASAAASQGTLELAPVIVAGALGAVLGDSALYWIARTGPRRLKARLEAGAEKDERVSKGLALLGRSGLLSLTIVRMLPVALSLLGTGARRPTLGFVGWFGPRGLATIVFAVILIDESSLPHERTMLLAVVATIGISVFAHGLSSRPLTNRYVGWYASHPKEDLPAMESVPAAKHRWRKPHGRIAESVPSSTP